MLPALAAALLLDRLLRSSAWRTSHGALAATSIRHYPLPAKPAAPTALLALGYGHAAGLRGDLATAHSEAAH